MWSNIFGNLGRNLRICCRRYGREVG